MKKRDEVKRIRETFDTELALTNDLYQMAMKLAIATSWRVAMRALYYVAMRIGGTRGRKQRRNAVGAAAARSSTAAAPRRSTSSTRVQPCRGLP